MDKKHCYWRHNAPPQGYFIVVPLSDVPMILAEAFPSQILSSRKATSAFYWRCYEPYEHGWCDTIEEAKMNAENHLRAHGFNVLSDKQLNFK